MFREAGRTSDHFYLKPTLTQMFPETQGLPGLPGQPGEMGSEGKGLPGPKVRVQDENLYCDTLYLLSSKSFSVNTQRHRLTV